MTIDKIIIDKSWGKMFGTAQVTIDVLLDGGVHYIYDFNVKSRCEPATHLGKDHTDDCYQLAIQKKFGDITGKILMYEHNQMNKLKA